MAMNQRERKIAIFTGITVGAVGLYAFVLEPLLTRLDEAQALLDANSADEAAALSLLERQDRDKRKWREIAGQRIPDNAGAAESQLINRVQDAARRAGIKIEQVQSRPVEREHNFARVQRSVSATGNLQQISRFLHAMQTSDIPLKMTDIRVTSKAEGTDNLGLTVTVTTLVASPQGGGNRVAMSRSVPEALQ